MENENENVTQYLIPANVTTKFEFFTGFGWAELRFVAITLIIGTAIFFALGMPKRNVLVQSSTLSSQTVKQSIVPAIPRAMFIIIPGLTSFFLVKRDGTTGASVLSLLKASREFKKNQKLYLYRYKSGTEG